LASCAAVGSDPARALGMAMAIELTHEFSLIHDDIQDGDRQRRGRDSLWTVAGIPQAINAGDALFSMARQQLSATALPAELLVEAYRRYDAACLELAEGQYLDIGFEQASEVKLPEYLRMVEGKTGALLGASAALGALAGGADGATVDAFDRYGRALGQGFQIQDDVLGIWGNPAQTGKPAGNDLRRRKRSLPVVLAASAEAIAADLSRIYADPQPAAEGDVATLTDAMEAAGLRSASESKAQELAQAAIGALEGLDLVEGPRELLIALVHGAVDRTR
jgi:geranylgeranyl diphosphate synthase type I